jgi:hypothetical protein
VRRCSAIVVVLALATVCCVVLGPTPAGTAGFTVPATIPADCSRDVSAELNAWVASVPDGSTLQFAPAGCYRVDRKLTVRDRNGLTFEGNGATFRAFTDGRELPPSEARTRSMFTFWQGSNLTVRNTIVRGANPHAGIDERA